MNNPFDRSTVWLLYAFAFMCFALGIDLLAMAMQTFGWLR